MTEEIVVTMLMFTGPCVVVMEVMSSAQHLVTFRAHDGLITMIRWQPPATTALPTATDAMDIDGDVPLQHASTVLLTASAKELRMWNVAQNTVELERQVLSVPPSTFIAGFDLSPNALMVVVALWYDYNLLRKRSPLRSL